MGRDNFTSKDSLFNIFTTYRVSQAVHPYLPPLMPYKINTLKVFMKFLTC